MQNVKRRLKYMIVILLAATFYQPMTFASEARTNNTDKTVGKIIKIDEPRSRIKLSHGELKNLGMHSMTMFFGVTGNMDLADFTVDDKVEVEIKRGRDGSYRVIAMCTINEQGEHCLDKNE